MHRGVLPVALVGLLLLPAVSDAVAQRGLAASRQAALTVRVLAYCRGVQSRATNRQVDVAVLYQPGNQASEKQQRDLVRAMRRVFGSTSIHGRKVEARPLAYSDASSLERDLESKGIDVVFITTGLDGAISEIIQVSRKLSRLTMGSEASYISEGVGIGLVRRGSKPTILVNMKATKAESARVDTGLLRVAEVVR